MIKLPIRRCPQCKEIFYLDEFVSEKPNAKCTTCRSAARDYARAKAKPTPSAVRRAREQVLRQILDNLLQ